MLLLIVCRSYDADEGLGFHFVFRTYRAALRVLSCRERLILHRAARHEASDEVKVDPALTHHKQEHAKVDNEKKRAASCKPQEGSRQVVA